MLERAAVYVEPASQAFLQRIETPLRSSRVLSSGFFRHGLSVSEPPVWWLQYLKTVRRVPQASDSQFQKPRPVAVPLRRRRSQSTTTAATVSRAAVQPLSDRGRSRVRSFSATAAVEQKSAHAHAHAVEPLDVSEESQNSWMFDDANQDPFTQLTTGTAPKLDEQTISERSEDTDSYNAAEASDDPELRLTTVEARLNELFDVAAVNAKDPAAQQYGAVWTSFIALPEQGTYASRVLKHLSRAEQSVHLVRAAQAFELIPVENRSKEDYDTLVMVASRRAKVQLVCTACKEAKERGMEELCRQTAILWLLTKGYWTRAAQVWDECWADAGKLHPDAGMKSAKYVHESSLTVLDSSPKLPEALTRLCEHLERPKRSVRLLPNQRSTLLDAARGLSFRLVSSGRLMSMITPEGLLRAFDSMATLGILKHEHFVIAIQTLASESRTDRARHDLAVLIYRNHHFRFPDRQISSHVMHGLIHLCYKGGEKFEAFDYLLNELRARGNDDGHVLPTRSDYVGALRAMAWQGNVEAVKKLYEQFLADHKDFQEAKEIVPSLYVHAILGDVTETQRAFDNLASEFQFAPDTVCWNILMYAHVRSPEPQNAFQVFDAMLAARVEPDAYTFATMVSICARVGDVSNVLSFLDAATRRGMKDIRLMLANLVHAYCLNGEIEQAETLVANLSELEMDKSPVPVWNELLKYHAFCSDVAAVRNVQQQMKAAGVEPDVWTYGTVMATLIRSGQTMEALNVMRSLHFGSRVAVTPFLYGLVLHGFQRERNHDMVSMIYSEVCARFPAPSPGAKLSKLSSEAEIGLLKSRQFYEDNKTPGTLHQVDFTRALSFLESIDRDHKKDPSGKVAKSPQPGFTRQSAIDAVPGIYFASIAQNLAVHGKPNQARGLLDWSDQRAAKSGPDRPDSIRMLTTRMLVAREQMVWSRVDELWRQILENGLKASMSPLHRRNLFEQSGMFPGSFQISATAPVEAMEELQHKVQASRSVVLPAQRFTLSVALTRYMISLDRQDRHDELIRIVELFQALGFRLTGNNWNVYVQCLCGSVKNEHRLTAYTTFATILFPFMSTYNMIDKGRWIDPEVYRATPRQSRKQLQSMPLRVLARVHPEVTPPSYVTTIHLARVLLSFERLAQQGNDRFINEARKKYPLPFKRILDLPQLPDAVQRVLLLKKRPHAPTRDAYDPPVSREGALQPRSILEHLPPERHQWAISSVKTTKRAKTSESQQSMLEDIALAEEALGEIPREPLFRELEGRFETPEEQSDRVSKTMIEYLSRIEDLEKIVGADSLVIGDETGDPVHRPIWNMEGLEEDKHLWDLAQERAEAAPPADSAKSPKKASKKSSGAGKISRAAAMADHQSQKIAALSEESSGSTASPAGDHVEDGKSSDLKPEVTRRLKAQSKDDAASASNVSQSVVIKRLEGRLQVIRRLKGKIKDKSTVKSAENSVPIAWSIGVDYNRFVRKIVPMSKPSGSKSIMSKPYSTLARLHRALDSSRGDQAARAPSRVRLVEQPTQLAIMRAESASPGGVAVHHIRSLTELNDTTLYSREAAAKRKAATPLPDIPDERLVYRKNLPPKRKGNNIDRNYSLRKLRHRLRRHAIRYEIEAVQRIRSQQGADLDARSKLLSELDLPLSRQQEQRRLEEIQEISSRTGRLQSARAAQRKRLERSLSFTPFGHFVGKAAERKPLTQRGVLEQDPSQSQIQSHPRSQVQTERQARSELRGEAQIKARNEAQSQSNTQTQSKPLRSSKAVAAKSSPPSEASESLFPDSDIDITMRNDLPWKGAVGRPDLTVASFWQMASEDQDTDTSEPGDDQSSGDKKEVGGANSSKSS